MCLCGKGSEKAIKWRENMRPQVNEMKVLHLRGDGGLRVLLLLDLEAHTAWSLNNS